MVEIALIVLGSCVAAAVGVLSIDKSNPKWPTLALLICAGAVLAATSGIWAARDAGRLESSLESIRTPLHDVYVSYGIDLPINDVNLSAFRRRLLVDAVDFESSKHPSGFYSPPHFPYSRAFLDGFSSSRLGLDVLLSMDLEIEFYQPPFPSAPFYSTGVPARRDPVPDYRLWTDVAASSRDDSAESSSYAKSAYQVVFTGAPKDIATHPSSVWVAAFMVPTVRNFRTERIDSINDLSGSMMFVHLASRIQTFEQPLNAVLVRTKLLFLQIVVDGVQYNIPVHKMKSGVSPLTKWYELDIPGQGLRALNQS